MTRLPNLLLLMLLGTLPLALSQRPLWAQEAQTAAWDALPAETFAAVRVPQAREFVELLRQRTKFGQVALSEKQIERYSQFIEDSSGEALGEVRENLNRFGLRVEDWTQLFDGPAGLGVTLQPRADGQPLVVLLVWAEPGEDLATRLVKALELSIEEAMAEDEEIRRIDTELAGTRVMHLSFPEHGFDVEFDEEPAFEEMTEEEMEAHWERQEQKWENAELITVDRTNLLVARLGGRLVAAVIPPQAQELARQRMDQGAPLDWDELTGVEMAKGTLSRFLSAQQQAGAAPRGFGQRMAAVPGMEPVLGTGVSWAEAFLDVPTLLELARQQANRDPDTDAAELERYFDAFGVNRLGPVGLRMALDGHHLRGGIFASAPHPRRGLVGLLDQPALQPQPPAWVAADVDGYTHFSADLGGIYDRIKGLAIDLGGDEARQGIEQAEQQAQMFLQNSPRDLLAALGTRHVLLQFATRVVEVQMTEWDPETGEEIAVNREIPQQRMAYVWQLEDEPAWQRMMGVIGGAVPMAGGAVQPVEEQGFRGYRIDREGFSAALFQGRGHLVFAVGTDVAAPVLSMISNPPQGEAALVASPLQRRASELARLRPGLMYGVGNMGRSAANGRQMLRQMFDAMQEEAGGPDATGFDVAKLAELLPSADELEASFGVQVSQGYATDDGVAIEWLMEMTPAE